MMNRAEIDTYIAQIEVEATRLRAKLAAGLLMPPAVKDAAVGTLQRVDELLTHPGLGTFKYTLDNYERLAPGDKSQVTQLYTWWTENARETVKTLQMLSDTIR